MTDVEQLKRYKEKILSTIRLRGPSLPVWISKALEVEPLFAAAFLSELKGEDKVKISSMRVGSSPLYYIPGQENLLENFSNYLNQREREALELLKKNSILEDEKQMPVVRVALRAIKDFAVPVRVRIDGESKLFWKHFLIDDDNIGEIISKANLNTGTGAKQKDATEKNSPQLSVAAEVGSKVDAKENSSRLEGDAKVSKEIPVEKEKVEGLKNEIPVKKIEKKISKVKMKESDFGNSVRDFLSGKDVELLEVFEEKKREFEGKVRVDTLFGKQEFYVVAKDKKSSTENDLAIAWQRAHQMKLPALVMSTGELNKKGKEHLKSWGNLVRFEKLKL